MRMLVDEMSEVAVMTIDRLSPDDRLLLLSDKVWPQDVGAILILDCSGVLDADGRFPIDWAREAMAQRIDALARLRQVLRVPRRGLGGPFWADAPAFDLSQHVRLAPPIPSDLPRVAGARRRAAGRRRADPEPAPRSDATTLGDVVPARAVAAAHRRA